MTPQEFQAQKNLPSQTTPPLRALWWDRQGDWEKAHDLVQNCTDSSAAWVHAYLHRKEGDQGNAAYWYRQAGKPVCREPLMQEWEAIVAALLAENPSV